METLDQLDTMAAELLAQMPDVMQAGTAYGTDLFYRFITYALVMNILGLIFMLALGGIGIFYAKKFWKMIDTNSNYYDAAIMKAIIVSALTVLLLTSNVVGMIQIKNIVQLIFVPELYLIEYFL